MLIEPGRYKGNVAAHSITETKAGDPQATVTFKITVNGAEEQVTWNGSFKEKAVDFTIKALIACGLQGNNPAGPLTVGKEVSLVIENEVGTDGKERSKVKWVNEPGALKKIIDPSMAKAKLSSLEGAVMLARQNHKTQPSHTSEEPDWMKD